MTMPKDLDPSNYPSEKDAENLTDDGSNPNEEEEQEEEEEEQPPRKPAKKAAKKAPAKKEESEEEEDPDEEEEEESDEDDEPEEEEEPAQKTHTVPLSALKKAQRKAAEAASRAQQLQDKLDALASEKSDKQKADFQKLNDRLDSLYDQVEEARAEGRTKDAAKLQREIDQINGDMNRAQAAWMATQQAVKQQNLMAYNSLVKVLEEVDPRFDEEADEYDADIVDRVGELTEAYEAKGLASPEALRKAVKVITGSDPFRTNRALARDDKKQPEEKKKAPARKTDVRKNLDAQKKQPAEEPADHKEKQQGKVDVATISEADWDKLPESKKRELRGDFG